MIEAFITVLNFFLGIALVIVAAWFAWMSSVLVSEKKARYRAGTHDYYDRPIEEDDSLMNIVYSNKDGDEDDGRE